MSLSEQGKEIWNEKMDIQEHSPLDAVPAAAAAFLFDEGGGC